MNISQLATAVGQRLGTDTSVATSRDGAAVRSFLTIRHDQLYRSFLWRDSIVEFEIPIDPSTPYVPTANYMPTKGRVILPSIFQHVLGARLGWRSLDVQRPMLFYRADYARFMRSGYTADFTLLSSCVWEFDVAQTLSLVNANPTDDNVNVTIDTVSIDEVSINRSSVATITTGKTVGTTDRVDNITKPATQDLVNLVERYYPSTPADTSSIPCLPTPISNVQVGTTTSNSISIGQTIKLVGIDNFTGLAATLTILITSSINPNLFVGTWTQQSGESQSTFLNSGASIFILTTLSIVSLKSSDLSAPKCQRIQLIGKPKTTGQKTCNLHVLGKRVTPPFSAETDTPGINGIEGVLFALAYYDFKARDEAGGSADANAALLEAVGPNFLTRGVPGGFLGKLIEEECVQAAYNTRIIPSEGFGGDCYFDEPYGSKSNPYW